MIVKMNKYDFVLYRKGCEEFLQQLQELGLVDITTSGWEPDENARTLMAGIEGRRRAVERLSAALPEDETPARPFDSGAEAYDKYVEAASRIEALEAQIARGRKEASELAVWGEFSGETIARLAEQGVVLRFFSAYDKEFAANAPQWGATVPVEPVANIDGVTYFVAVTRPGQEISIDAQELKAPTMTAAQKAAEIAATEKERAAWEDVMKRCAASVGAIESDRLAMVDQLGFNRAAQSGSSEADGSLTILEGWAPEEAEARLDAVLDANPDVLYIKSRPTPEDETPVLLKNNRFARLFELIGSMYALPKYGTIDLTPLFAPLYMLLFAICLNDAGYGLILLAAGIALLMKGGPKLRQASTLTVVCGTATVLFGFYSNSFFGMQISEAPMFKGIHFLNFQEQFFTIALAMGVVQILLGMAVNIYMTAKMFGVKYSLGTLGWFLLLLSGCLAGGLNMLNESWVIPGFTTDSPAFLAAVGISLALMLLFNTPGKNIFVNIGSGLWNTYNNITGLLSDVLSYIRLFAIGLSGGVLAQVFNALALGLTGLDGGISGPWWSTALQIVGASIILLIGHGINLFMSAISSFVHPMRLTFVEFYKNAGFEAATRLYDPLKKSEK